MKNKMLFIMPRLVGATVVVGAAALIVSTLFKLLLGLTLIGGVITLATQKAGRRRNRFMAGYDQDALLPGLGRRNALGNNNFWGNQRIAVGQSAQKAATIIPIN